MKIDHLNVLIFALYFASILFSYYLELSFSPRLIFGASLIFTLFFIQRKKPTLDKITLILIIFGIYSFLLETLFLGIDASQSVWRLAIHVVFPLIIIQTIKAFASTTQKRDVLIKIMLFLIMINILIAIGQVFLPNIFWNVRASLNSDMVQTDRPAGLSYYIIDFTYQIIAIGTLAFIYFSKNNNPWKIIIPIFVIIAAVLSLTRTCALIIILLALLYTFNKHMHVKKKTVLTLLAIGGILTTPLIFSESNLSRLSTLDDSSAELRVPLAIAAISSIQRDPFGTTIDAYYATWTQSFTPHNQFLNIAVFFGLPMLILLIVFCVVLFRTAYYQYKISEPGREKIIAHLLLLSLTGYTFNSMFHNAGFFQSNLEIYMVIGILLANKQLLSTTKHISESIVNEKNTRMQK